MTSKNVIYSKCWNYFYGVPIGGTNYWVRKSRIPLGTKRPYEIIMDEKGYIPEEEIVSVPFDPVDTPFTSRKAFNMLILGGSGDGKSLLMKNIWFFLHEAGYFCGYIDPKSTDSGRARMKWEYSPRLPPATEPKGIQLQHFMPVWATKKYEEMIHNFRIYSTDLMTIDQKEMWKGLGMSSVSASVINTIVNTKNTNPSMWKERFGGGDLTVERMKSMLPNISKNRLPANSQNNAFRVLTDIEDTQLVDSQYQNLDLYREWKRGNSICVSYNNASRILMTFDIGHKISQSADLVSEKGNQTPIQWFLDDAAYFAKEFKHIEFNFALQEILNIGFNYRTRGLNNILAVQSLNIIDEEVAEAYPLKIITPKFKNIEQLTKIAVPNEAIQWLKSDELVIRKQYNLIQMILIDENNQPHTFFPFTPASNHFTEIYFPDYGNKER